MTDVIELSGPPRTGALYRRVALGLLRRGSGTTLPETTLVLRQVRVSRDRLAAYNGVCGFRLSDRLPATYPHVLAFPLGIQLMSAPDFPVPVLGVVHVGNRIEQLRPIGADEILEFSVRAADLRPHDRGRQFDIRVTAAVGDEVVWRSASTYLHRSGPSGPRPATEPTEPAPVCTLWTVDRRVGRRYAEVSGDRNPIHVSRLGARAFGFPRPIAHGMWSKARCLAGLEGRLPDAYTVEVAFKAPILLPGKVNYVTAQSADGWSIGLYHPRSGKPHLLGTVSSIYMQH